MFKYLDKWHNILISNNPYVWHRNFVKDVAYLVYNLGFLFLSLVIISIIDLNYFGSELDSGISLALLSTIILVAYMFFSILLPEPFGLKKEKGYDCFRVFSLRQEAIILICNLVLSLHVIIIPLILVSSLDNKLSSHKPPFQFDVIEDITEAKFISDFRSSGQLDSNYIKKFRKNFLQRVTDTEITDVFSEENLFGLLNNLSFSELIDTSYQQKKLQTKYNFSSSFTDSIYARNITEKFIAVTEKNDGTSLINESGFKYLLFLSFLFYYIATLIPGYFYGRTVNYFLEFRSNVWARCKWIFFIIFTVLLAYITIYVFSTLIPIISEESSSKYLNIIDNFARPIIQFFLDLLSFLIERFCYHIIIILLLLYLLLSIPLKKFFLERHYTP